MLDRLERENSISKSSRAVETESAGSDQRLLHGRNPAATASSSLRNHNPALVRLKYGESGEWQRIELWLALTVYSGAGAEPSGRGNADPGYGPGSTPSTTSRCGMSVVGSPSGDGTGVVAGPASDGRWPAGSGAVAGVLPAHAAAGLADSGPGAVGGGGGGGGGASSIRRRTCATAATAAAASASTESTRCLRTHPVSHPMSASYRGLPS